MHVRRGSRAVRAAAWFLAAAVVGCGGGGGGGGGGGTDGPPADPGAATMLKADVFPMSVGDRRLWQRTSAQRDDVLHVERVEASTSIDGRGVFVVRDDLESEAEYLVVGPTGVTVVPGPDADALLKALGPVELLRFDVPAGSSFTAADRAVSMDLDEDGRNESVAVNIRVTHVGRESIATPAGTFADASRVRTQASVESVPSSTGRRLRITVVTDDWYAPGVGPVRSSSTTTVDASAQTETQTETEELRGYVVGAKRSDDAPPKVVATNIPADGGVRSNLQVRLTFDEPLAATDLTGPGGVRLVAPDGGAVPLSSTQLFFSPTRTEILVSLPDSVRGAPNGSRYELRQLGALTDWAGNPAPVALASFTVDNSGPNLVSSTPAAGSQDVAVAAGTWTFEFDEEVFVGPSIVLQVTERSNTAWQSYPLTKTGPRTLSAQVGELKFNTDYVLRNGPPDSSANWIVDARGTPMAELRLEFRTTAGPLSRPTQPIPGHTVKRLTSGDIDGDGRPELVAAAAPLGDTDAVAVWVGGFGSDGRALAPRAVAQLGPSAPGHLLVADVDGNGRNDIVVGLDEVLLQASDGSFARESLAGKGFSGGWPMAWPSGSGSGSDRRQGLLAYEFMSDVFSVMERQADGTWTRRVVLDVRASGLSVGPVENFLVADLNSDGRPDLAWTVRDPAFSRWRLAWALNQGDRLAPAQSLIVGDDSPMGAMRAGDLDGDGQVDIAVVVRRGIRLFKGTTGGFSDLGTIETWSVPQALAVADMDGDGRLDLADASDGAGTVQVRLQDANGLLQPPRSFEGSDHLSFAEYEFRVEDFNADGRPDIVLPGFVLLSRPFQGAWPQSVGGSASAARRVGLAAARRHGPLAALPAARRSAAR